MSDLDALGSMPRAVAAVTLLLASAWGASACLLPRCALWQRRKTDVILLRIAVGLNLVAMLGVTLGQAGVLASSHSLWLLAALALLSFVPNVLAAKSAPLRRVCIRRSFGPGLLLLAPVVLTLGAALCYPVGWDELVYHSVLPRRWLAAGRPAFYLDLPYSGFPSLGEILFWLMTPLESLIAPRLLNWICWALGLAILYRLLRRHIARSAAAALTCAFAVAPATLLISANIYVETILMMNVGAMLLTVHLWRRRSTTCFVVLGILAGGTAAVKLTGLAALALPVIWSACLAQHRTRRTATMRGALLSLIVAAAIALPFYLRPWLATGNPCYPYFAEWFSNNPARLEMSRYHHALGSVYGVRSLPTFVAGPMLLAFEGKLYDGSFGWQFAVMLGLAAFALMGRMLQRRGSSRGVAFSLTAAAWLYVCWFLTAQQARFVVPAALMVVVASGAGLRRVPGVLRFAVLAALLLGSLVSFPIKLMPYYLASWEKLAGWWTAAEYVDDGTRARYVPLVRAIRDLTPENARVALLFEDRSLYVPRECVVVSPFFQEQGFTPPEHFANAERVMELLESQGVTHLVLSKSPTGPDRAPEWFDRLVSLLRGLHACLDRGDLRIIWESDEYAVLALH